VVQYHRLILLIIMGANKMVSVEQLDSYLELYDVLDKRVYDVWEKYMSGLFYTQYGHTPDSIRQRIDHWEIYSNTVDVYWSDSWRYGGYDSGRTCIPIHFLTDESALNDFIIKCKADKDAKTKTFR
jgi:hypothetical protein